MWASASNAVKASCFLTRGGFATRNICMGKGFWVEQSPDIIVHMPELTLDFNEPKRGHGQASFINGRPICVGKKYN